MNKAGFTVTAIQRADSKKVPQGAANKIKVDLTNESALTTAFKDQDVVVSALPNPRLASDKIWINAAIAAGVKRIVPSEYSTNMDNKLAQKLPIITDKVEIRKYIEELGSSGKIEWSSVNNGPFFVPWIWLSGWMGPNPKTKTATYHDGGYAFVGTSTLDRIGEGVAASLTAENAAKTKNKTSYVYSTALSERKVTEIVSKLLDGVSFEEKNLNIEQLTKDAFAAHEKDPKNDDHLHNFYIPFCFGEGYGGDFRDISSNKELGLKEMSEDEVEGFFKKALQGNGLIQ